MSKKSTKKATTIKKNVKKAVKNSCILIISDMHAPYGHQDTIPFLKEIKRVYKPDRVVCVGDEVDKHAMSFHDSDPDLMSAGDELQAAIEALKPLYKLFPVMDLVDSNHGSMVYRKSKAHGISRKYIRDYGDVLESPVGWKWHLDLKVKMSDGQSVYIHHGLKIDPLKVAQELGINHVSGHFHNSFQVKYASTPEKLLWGMTVGCLVDDKSLAFNYNKNTLGRPIIGTGIIIDGQPMLIPMVLNKCGRWIGKLV